MKLARYGPGGNERPLVVVEQDTNARAFDVGDYVGDFGAGFWFMGGPRIFRNAEWDGFPEIDLDAVRLGPPVPRPSKVVCIGLNYHDHAAESGLPVPTEPVVFMKAPNTIVGPRDDVIIPRGSTKTDWEVELAVVIAKQARYLPDPPAAREVIGGYVLSNDVSEREFQLERGGQWDKGKSCETFNPLGPWLLTPDEIEEPQQVDLWLSVNGEKMQSGSTADMVFTVDHIIWYLSQFMVLEPGDLINTGTPAGVGLGLEPQRFLQPGDDMELGASGLGTQQHRCVPAPEPRDFRRDSAIPPTLHGGGAVLGGLPA